jgi:uncharacterized protein
VKHLHAVMVPLAFAAALLPASALAEFAVPKLTGPVVDDADMLSSATEAKLERFIRGLHESGGSQLEVATVPNLGGLSIEEASIKITDQWKLGGAKTDNGVLLLIARDERKIRIEVGQGLEGNLPDAYASRIIRDIIAPNFKGGDVDRGVLGGVAAIVHYTDPDYLKDGDRSGTVTPSGSSGGDGGLSGHDLETLLMIFFFTFLILPALFGRRRRRGLWWLGGGGGGWGGGGFGGGGFGGGGGWSGGGGGFSGGGASGGW